MAHRATAITMPISRCLGVSTALHPEKKLLRVAERELIAKESGALTWKQLVEDWEVDIRRGSSFGHSPISPKTLMCDVETLQLYNSHWNNRRVGTIKRPDLIDVLKETQRKNLSQVRPRIIRNEIDKVIRWGYALQWDCVDFEGERINVHRSYDRIGSAKNRKA